MGLKGKINFAIVTVIVLSIGIIALFSYKKSSDELTAAVETSNMYLLHATASDIYAINEREFKMIESLANLSIIRDPSVDMHEKWELVNSATGGNNRYYGLGFFGADGIGYATTGIWNDLHTREYLRISMQGKRALQDPDYSKVNGHLCTYYAVPVKDPDGKQIAEISAVVDATDLCRTVSRIKVGKSSHPFIISRTSGKYVAHDNAVLVSEGTLAEEGASEAFKDVLKTIMTGETGSRIFTDDADNIKYSVAYQPIDGTNWSVICMAPYADFYGGIFELLKTMIIIGAAALVVAFIIGFIVVHFSVRSLSKVSGAIEEIATGHADLTKRLETTGTKDEIGRVVENFNGFTKKLQAIVTQLKSSKEELYGYGEQLSKTVTDNDSSRVAIMDDIKNVNREIDGQHNLVNGTAGAADKISVSLEQLNKLLEKQAESAEQASAAVTEMLGNVASVSSSVEKMALEFDKLQEDVNNGIQSQKEVSEKITQIEEQSKMLNEANNVISSIAEQTNLLAMNAAIEAAHAGESGKGFSVVADEIRKLSENSSAQSHNIESQLKSILVSISNAVNSSEISDKVFSSVIHNIQGTGTLVHQIKLAMEEQHEGSKQIGESLNTMNEAAAHVRKASNDVDGARREIINDVSDLTAASDSVKDFVSQMTDKIQQIEAADSALLNIASLMSSSIYSIGDQIDQFKV